MPGVRSVGRLGVRGSVLLLCDMQEKFRPNIVHFTDVVSNSARLLQVCRILGVPPLVTEQYPHGLGPSVPELGLGDLRPFPKTAFSMLGAPGLLEALGAAGGQEGVTRALLCGIETQACIACTTYDLLEKGIEVHIVADAVSSRRQSGAFLTTVEGAILQLVQDAAHPRFKEIQKLLVHPSPDTGLLSFFH
ncbi:isochorismatase domain-containing protein 2 isoform X2 [Amia ocellicauda]|uniref:isochorismatase domain-containing protein 2 isoform X2 n=1 Tax=Amia ocellicauda TaxID=2972642 RepID=UPI00346389A5